MAKQNDPQPESEAPKVEEKSILPKVGMELSKVASNPKQSIIIIVIGILATLYLAYGMLKSDSDDVAQKNNTNKVEKPKIIIKPTQEISANEGPLMPSLPKAPALQDPSAPPPIAAEAPKVAPAKEKAKAPVPPALPHISMKDAFEENLKQPVAPPLTTKAPTSPLIAASQNNIPTKIIAPITPKILDDPEVAKQKEQRKKSSIMLISGAPQKSQEQIAQDAAFKPRSNLEYTLAKGKIIDAVIENAINTDFAGEVRAVISRDVFSESGKIILIPKGARVFGTFSSTVDALYGKININWDRIDLPAGYTLTFAGTAIDDLGRKGVVGRLDNKIKEKLSGTILSTALNVAFASAVDKLVPPEQTAQQATLTQGQATSLQTAVQAAFTSTPATNTTANMAAQCSAAKAALTDPTTAMYQQVITACNAISNGTTTPASLNAALMAAANSGLTSTATTSTPTKAQAATQQGMTDFSTAVTDILKQTAPKPTVTIDQGTQIKIYVTQDYKFPKAAINGSRLIQ